MTKEKPAAGSASDAGAPLADFTPQGYRALLGALLARGYTVKGFAEAAPNARHLILRHDLDMSLEAALPLAEIERDLGLRASYFVLLRSEMYNPFSVAVAKVLDRLVGLGHDIGLHLDASLYAAEEAALADAAVRECAMLEATTGRAVTVVSFHRPAPGLLGGPDRIAGRLSAYGRRFFHEMGYCSDSRGAWHFGPPLDHPAMAEGRALQLLTHPIWWLAKAGGSVQVNLDRFAEARLDRFRRELARNCTAYDPDAAFDPEPGSKPGSKQEPEQE